MRSGRFASSIAFYVSRLTFHVAHFLAPSLRHVNILQLRIPLHRRHAEVTAQAALFEAAEGSFDVDAGVAVDAEDAALDLARNTQGSAQVVGPNRAAQAVARIVHFAQH